MFTKPIPLSLYIHIPWCVRKCPYCDFNSHAAKESLPEELYTEALLQELDFHQNTLKDRPLISIFFGGGTPSLFSPHSIQKILAGIKNRFTLEKNIEITLEANPGTIDAERFTGFREAGINRLSLGIQSLQNDKLQTLGRIHDRNHAMRAIELAKQAGFDNFNLDMMYGLPNQTIEEALEDIKNALPFNPTHFSWYQLTIEPNTLFHHQPPPLPTDDTIWEMQLAGQDYLQSQGFLQYEVSAYANANQACLHNRNYWEFGDYLGIGAGAYSKITDTQKNRVTRFSQVKNPRDYLNAEQRVIKNYQHIQEKDLIFEFMLNALRLTNGFSTELFTQRTGIAIEVIAPLLNEAIQRGLLQKNADFLIPTELGKRYLNNLMQMFL